MSESNSIPFAQLLDWLEGRLSDEEARSVVDRLQQANEPTRQDLAWLRAFGQASQAVTLAQPPHRLREALTRRFLERREAQQPPGLFRQLLAGLTFDSRTRLAAAGVRSASDEGRQRQLIYSSDQADIALNIAPREQDERLDLSGQLFSTSETLPGGASVQLLQDETQVGLTTVDELGEFAFQGISPGAYDMVVSVGTFEVVISPLPLQS